VAAAIKNKARFDYHANIKQKSFQTYNTYKLENLSVFKKPGQKKIMKHGSGWLHNNANFMPHSESQAETLREQHGRLTHASLPSAANASASLINRGSSDVGVK